MSLHHRASASLPSTSLNSEMLLNSSNDSISRPNSCFDSREELLIFTVFCLIHMLLTPVFVFVLYIGWQRWRKQRSGSMATPTSHTDVFTYNVIALEMISIVESALYCCGRFTHNKSMIVVAEDSFFFTSFGQSLFHVLTCVDRYLAVVHPITYLSLRHSGGIQIRNISTAVVWLLCFGALVQSEGSRGSMVKVIVQPCVLVVLLSVVSFCSISVLRVLNRPGPGKGGTDKLSVDQSKQKAFHTITAIMGALWLRFVGVLFSCLMSDPRLSHTCVLNSLAAWLTLPGDLVLPLLFLHRAGKLPGCQRRARAEG